jgi:hypothetical protein
MRKIPESELVEALRKALPSVEYAEIEIGAKATGSPLHERLLNDVTTIKAILSNYSDEKGKIQEARDILGIGDSHDFVTRKKIGEKK